MGHNQSKLSNNMETQAHDKVGFPLSLRLNHASLSSQPSPSPRSASISSIESSDINYVGSATTIKGMMLDILNNDKTSNSNSNSKSNKSNADYEKFFIAFHQKQQQQQHKLNDITLYDTAIQHRVAFISIVGLYQSFRRIPTHILYSSIFILKLKSEWLYQPLQHRNKQNVLHSLQYDEDEEFLMLLKWKDSQGLMFFMHSNDTNDISNQYNEDEDNALPIDFGIESDHDYDNDVSFDFVPPLRLQRNQENYSLPVLTQHESQRKGKDIWNQLSQQLTQIYDPFCGSNYCSLVLDRNWWFNEFEQSEYGTSSKDIMDELNECHMNYRCVMEILFQSNPSLIPCKSMRDLEHVSQTAHTKPRPSRVELSEINAISNTISAVDSTMEYYSPMDCDDIELSHRFEIFDTDCSPCDWIIDDYTFNSISN